MAGFKPAATFLLFALLNRPLPEGVAAFLIGDEKIGD